MKQNDAKLYELYELKHYEIQQNSGKWQTKCLIATTTTKKEVTHSLDR